MSQREGEITCIVCAKGCRTAVREERGELRLAEKLCRNGREYVLREFRDPRRVLTSTVAVDGPAGGRLPVRTRGPVPKASLMDCMRAIARVSVSPPVQVGDLVLADLAGTGEDLVACAAVPVASAPPLRGC